MIYLIKTTSYSLLMRRNPQVRARVTALQSADRAVICPITREADNMSKHLIHRDEGFGTLISAS
ncbi:MAG TPA: hypothetical protein VE965_01165 [Gammaproteobacteria bacterium]|nr:hypothetical protein [Gammaproteobacteria bacterium]